MTAAQGTLSGPEYRGPVGLPLPTLIVLYASLGLLPLLLATLQDQPARHVWRELSSGLVMIGFAMILVQFLLSSRFRQVSGRLGIDVTMRFHQLVAWSILVFVLVHPFLYAAPRLFPNPADAFVSLQRMFGSPSLRTGVIAWFLLILLVVTAVWRDRLRFRYEIWRLSHGVGSALIAILSLDHTLRVGAYSADPLLTGFWFLLTGIALGSLVYVYGIKPLQQRTLPYRLVVNEKAADRMWRLIVEPCQGSAIEFAAGQFVWLNLGHSPFSLTEHPFSISSAPASRPRIEFTIKESGDFTGSIGSTPVGTVAYLDGPHGNFTLAGRPAAPLIMIAGGVGFAPIMGILRELHGKQWPYPVTVVYGNRIESQILYRYELESMREVMKLDLHLVLSQPPLNWTGAIGELTSDVLRICLGTPDPNALCFVCGPVPMMEAVEDALVDFGVPGNRVISERFRYD